MKAVSKHTRAASDAANRKPIALAEDLEATDVQGRLHEFVMMEKFDGVRYVWDGEHFSTKAGKQKIAPPALLAAMLPNIPLDGELWAGRMRFDQCVRMTGGHVNDGLKYVVFDTRDQPERPFKQRLADVRARLQALGADPSRVDVVEVLPCTCGGACLQGLAARDGNNVEGCGVDGCPAEFLKRVVDAGGEGIILRRDVSWKAGKHREVLKVKLRYDHEAVVVGAKPVVVHRSSDGIDARASLQLRSINQPGPVKFCECRPGSCQQQHVIDVPWKNARPVPCNPHDQLAAEALGWVTTPGRPGFYHPPPGTVVTYQYQRGMSTGHPRFPHFLRVHAADCDCDACALAAADARNQATLAAPVV